MAWQAEVGSGTDRATTYHDLLTKMVAFMTSQHVSAVAIDAAGTGYTVGDILTLTHAGAYLDARFEVLTVGGSGEITSLRISTSGAFSNRIASATVSAGGTNYAVNDVLEVQGGTFREKGKMRVATLSGSAVATVALFETGGAYSTAPTSPASTTKVGPTAGTGSGCTLTLTMTGLIGTTSLSVTGGTGSGAAVDITLAETGWTAERNANNITFNSVTNEKEVVLKGDAAGNTNKPYIGFTTLTRTNGLNTRYAIALLGMVAHAPASLMGLQPGLQGTPGVFSDGGTYLLCDENQLQSMDFWFSCDDRRICGIVDTNSGAAASDDRQFHHFYAGYIEPYATEVEDPYPLFIGASSRVTDVDPSASSTSITGLSECLSISGQTSPCWLFRSEDSTWINIENSEGTASQERQHIMWPLGRLIIHNVTISSDRICDNGPVTMFATVGSNARASPTARLLPVPGTSSLFFPFPLMISSKNSSIGAATQQDAVRGVLSGCFFVYNTDSSGNTITNFALDYLTIGSDRYRIFHTHVQRQLYHYIAIKEDV